MSVKTAAKLKQQTLTTSWRCQVINKHFHRERIAVSTKKISASKQGAPVNRLLRVCKS